MKRIANVLLVLVMLLMAIPQQALADASSALDNKNNYTVMPKGNGVFTIKVPVFVGGSGGNRWITGEGKVSVKTDKGNSYDILFLQSSNYGNNEKGSKDVSVKPNKSTGYFTFLQSNGSTKESGSMAGGFQSVNCAYEKDITGQQNTIFVEFIWKADYTTFKDRDLTFSFSATYETGNPFYKNKSVNQTIKTLSYKSTMVAPNIVGAYLDVEAKAGFEGQVKLVGYTVKKPEQMDVLVNDKVIFTTRNCDDNSINFVLDRSDITRVVVLRGYYNDEGTPATLESKPFTVKPYHSIKDVKVTEQHVLAPAVSSGYKEITWSVDTTDPIDMYQSDRYIIERSCYEDMSGAVQVGSVSPYDTIKTGKYKFVDKNNGHLVNSLASGSNKLYYRVRRSSAMGIFSTGENPYSIQADVENQCGKVPYVTDVIVKKDANFDTNRKVIVRTELRNYANNRRYIYGGYDSNISGYFCVAQWNDEANLNMVVLRDVGRETLTDTLKLNTKNMVYENGVYYVEKEYVMTEPGVYYSFKSFVDIPSTATNLRLVGDYDKDDGVKSYALRYTDLGTVTNVVASQGTEYGFVRVQWQLPGNRIDKMTLFRAKEGESPAEIATLDPTSTYYEDHTAELGEKYQYFVKAETEVLGSMHAIYGVNGPDGKVVYGWISNTGKITGKALTLQNGGISGQLINVTTADKEVIASTTTLADGSFEIDGLPLAKGGVSYTVQAGSEHLQFTYNGEPNGADVKLDGKNSLREGLKFVCSSVERFSGRVLFDNSTVPVSGASFLINDMPVYGSNGQLLTSDHDGNFEFYVPRQSVTVQVVKKGHHFANNGYIVDKDNGKSPFTPLSAYDGLTLYDETKVLLRGRVIGGNTLAALPLGQGLTENNLGDSITIQMKLEGNNTANIVYLKDEVEKDTLVQYYEQQWEGETVARTRTDFFRKHFNIHVDNETGEYAVEVFPTKYKVTQAYAQGYASLFANGEVSQVVDLTDSVSVDPDQTAMAQYSITYHSDVDITYKQLLWGVNEVDYLGAEEISSTNAQNKTVDIKLAYVNEDEEECDYVLGSPLFQGGEIYFLRGSAHEDYYYNNDVRNGEHFVEPVREGTATVVNGLSGSDPEAEQYKLNEDGQFTIKFIANNDNFSLTGEDALRNLNSSIEVNGFYYQSKPIEAFVTGARNKEGDVFTAKNANIELLDVLRDPPGASGSAYYGKGKQYEMTRSVNFTFDWTTQFEIAQGTKVSTFVGTYAGGTAAGTFTGATNNAESDFETTIEIPTWGLSQTRNVTYNFTSNRKISTSDDPRDVGAMADVYIGYTNDLICQTKQVICVIDSVTYTYAKPSIDAGLIKLIQEGEDPNGNKYYLVVGDQIDPQYSVPSTFVYSQKHIISKVIPQLISARNSLLVGGEGVTQEEVQAMATAQKKTLYYYKGDIEGDEYGVDYEPLYPNKKKPDNFVNEVEAYDKQILKWLSMIALNEKQKVMAVTLNEKTNENTFSVSAGQNIEYSEEIAYGELGYGTTANQNNFSLFGFSVNNLTSGNAGTSAADLATKLSNGLFSSIDTEKKSQTAGDREDFLKTMKSLIKDLDRYNDAAQKNVNETKVETPASVFTIKVTPVVNFEYDDSREGTPLKSCESGYELKLEDDSYLNFSVFRTPADSAYNADYIKELAQFVNKDNTNTDYLHEFIFVVNGGATRHPWIDADSTLVYKPGTPLSARTQKIDNPVMTITNPEVSNVPEDEKAVFQLKLTNDSEWTGNQSNEHVCIFSLSLVDESNENGAKISIDGVPLSDGRQFYIDPGETTIKTLEVARGVGYDFENLQLFFCCDEDEENSCTVSFSAHFLPSSSPVKIAAPTDKWVMNTYSAKDSVGYYMPVVIEGYDVNYNNFDHIELQYKKSTEGESGWTNLCSYYVDDELYEAASGTKSKDQILSGRITHPFYGEKDPIEMKYDLRAVTYCRLGTGYVTKASNVISGTKDTRRPTIFGQIEPTSGILVCGANIIIPFSENIAYNYLDETSNFDVRGYVNSSNIDTNVGLVFSGNDEQDAYTNVARNLANRNFTVDLLVQPAEEGKDMTFFSHGNANEGDIFEFGITSRRQLFANVNGNVVKSKPLTEPINQDITHVGVEFEMLDNTDHEGNATIHFFVGNSFIENDTETPFVCNAYYGNSPIHFGVSQNESAKVPFKGRMLEARLWNQALDAEMVSAYDHNILSGYRNRIIGYWPMRQAEGDAEDEANGADLKLKNVTWNTAKGHSLAINNKGYDLDGESFARSANFDYTLAFWMKMDEAADSTYIFSAGADELEEKGMNKLRIGFENGDFIVRTGGNTITLCDADQFVGEEQKGEWHHFAMSVSHSKNLAHFYLDGNMLQQVQGDKVEGINMNDVRLGDEGIKANIDLLTFWHQALPMHYLQYIKNYRLSGDEMGLYVYLPFDESQEDKQGTLSDRFVVTNQAKDNMDIYKKVMVYQNGNEDIPCEDLNAPVLASMTLSKLKFSWTSDGTRLLINLDMKDSEINNRNIYLTVRDVEDLNGNPMDNPFSCVIYPYRNILYWLVGDQVHKIKQGETVQHEVAWTNLTSSNVNYTISTSSPYIKLNNYMGMTETDKTCHLTYTITDGMTPGDYEEYIWLRDEDNDMTSELTLYITVEGEAPDWSVDRTKFDQTMTLIADVYTKVNGIEVLDTDTRDIVAAFIGSDCVGVSNISTNDDGLTQLYMNIYGNSDVENSPISFYLWDYSEGKISMLASDITPCFLVNAMVGMPPADPLKLVTAESEMQDINLQPGWNWIALNVKPYYSHSPNVLFLNNNVFSDGDIIKDDSQHTEYSASKKEWFVGIFNFLNQKVYRIYTHKATRANILGESLSKSDCEMTIKQGWNELPYLLNSNLPIRDAMTDFLIDEKASEGDIIKGIDAFAVLSKAYGWIGSLQTLEVGQGYYLYHTGKECNFNFKANESSATRSTVRAKAPRRAAVSEQNMLVIAALADDEQVADDAVIEAYAGAELVGEATPITLPDGSKRYFLSVAHSDANIVFVAQQTDVEPIVVGAMPYNGTTCIGSLESPYLLSTKSHLAEGDELYDLLGRRVDKASQRGIYVKKGMKMQIK